MVFVADTTLSMSDFENLNDIVFKNEKIGLAMKAFHAYRIDPEQADEDPILAEQGKGTPRLVVVDPLKEKCKVIEEKKIKVSGLYKAMKTVSNRFYKEKLDKLVKTHLKLLTERDQLANEVKVLNDKKTRLEEKGEDKKLKQLEKELAQVEEDLQKLAKDERELWKLTPKKSPA